MDCATQQRTRCQDATKAMAEAHRLEQAATGLFSDGSGEENEDEGGGAADSNTAKPRTGPVPYMPRPVPGGYELLRDAASRTVSAPL